MCSQKPLIKNFSPPKVVETEHANGFTFHVLVHVLFSPGFWSKPDRRQNVSLICSSNDIFLSVLIRKHAKHSMKNWHAVSAKTKLVSKRGFLKSDICKKLALETYTHVREQAVYWLHTCLNPLVSLSPVPTILRPSTFLLYSNTRLVASAAPVAGVNTDHQKQIPLSISSVSASSFSCYVTSVLGFPLECFQTYIGPLPKQYQDLLLFWWNLFWEILLHKYAIIIVFLIWMLIDVRARTYNLELLSNKLTYSHRKGSISYLKSKLIHFPDKNHIKLEEYI